MDYDGIHYYESTRDNLHLILFSTIGGLSDKKKNEIAFTILRSDI